MVATVSSHLSIVLSFAKMVNRRRYCYRPRRVCCVAKGWWRLRRAMSDDEIPGGGARDSGVNAAVKKLKVDDQGKRSAVAEARGTVAGSDLRLSGESSVNRLQWRLAGGNRRHWQRCFFVEINNCHTESLSFRRSRWIGELESKVVIQRSSCSSSSAAYALVRGRRELRIAGSMLPVGGEIHRHLVEKTTTVIFTIVCVWTGGKKMDKNDDDGVMAVCLRN
nr:hypothetical protein Iba_chr02cCG13220 [Ipomoea batatas]